MGISWGRSSFKLGNLVAANRTRDAEAWVEYNQRLFNRDEVWLRVFKENAGWSPVPEGRGMFGSPPRDPGIWNVEWLQSHWDHQERKPRRVRAENITNMNRRVTEWFFRTSQRTGCAFEICIIATLKHTPNIGNGHIDHIIRQELIMFDGLLQQYPKAKIIASACNEWDAHDKRETYYGIEQFTLWMCNMWANRRGRDRYWLNGELIVDHGGKDTFDYNVGPGSESYDWGMIHKERSPNDWYKAPNMVPLEANSNGRPLGVTESMYYVDPPDVRRAEKWYRNRAGWQHNPVKQMKMYENFERAGFDYIIVHDEKGAQCDPSWPRRVTELEARLAEKFGGTMAKYRYERIINLASEQILGRRLHEDGIASYNNQMKMGLTEAQVREAMIRSTEYNIKNPEGED